ncbi:MAG: AraC family transcriptional regulator [Lachnospiraceae bacterium]|nr:AraC family transcriptional regulator [Lachnospiraceae bacterium]
MEEKKARGAWFLDIEPDLSAKQDFNVGDVPIFIGPTSSAGLPGGKLPSHWNHGLETIYIKKGALKVSVSGTDRIATENELVIINPGYMHYVEHLADRGCEMIFFEMEEPIFSMDETIRKKYMMPIFHAMQPGFSVIPADSPYQREIRELLDRMLDANAHRTPAYDLRIIGIVHEYFAVVQEALQLVEKSMPFIGSRNAEAMHKMVVYIQQNYASSITMEDLCNAGCVARCKCITLFKQYTGTTPANYVLQYRLYLSRYFLRHTDMPLSQIASICGFTHQSHFTSRFTRYHNMTPLQFRKSEEPEQNPNFLLHKLDSEISEAD